MKLTAANFLSEYPKIDKSKIKKIVDAYPTAFEDFEFYNDDDSIKESIDMFIDKINKVLDNTDGTTKPAIKRKYVKGKGGKITGRRKKGEPKPKKEKKKVKKETSKKPKKEAKEEKQKTKKAKVGESPKWLKTLESFVKSYAGKTKDTWRVRNFVSDIQAYFSKKHGNSTPNIDLISEIQDKLIKYANSDAKKVSIPDYTDLVSRCKTAIKNKGFSISNKAKKPSISSKELSGFAYGFKK